MKLDGQNICDEKEIFHMQKQSASSKKLYLSWAIYFVISQGGGKWVGLRFMTFWLLLN